MRVWGRQIETVYGLTLPALVGTGQRPDGWAPTSQCGPHDADAASLLPHAVGGWEQRAPMVFNVRKKRWQLQIWVSGGEASREWAAAQRTAGDPAGSSVACVTCALRHASWTTQKEDHALPLLVRAWPRCSLQAVVPLLLPRATAGSAPGHPPLQVPCGWLLGDRPGRAHRG